ncbi:preprotein translocase subunit YajC [Glaciecola sp. 1036]|uniref:preprotein translocase subunit YajC n=1 Tax=Alteromonadaceae TaxID=72275 RepID=UPI003D00F755
MSLFISPAYAQEAGPGASGGFGPLIMLAVFGLIFYFLLYRPQAKRVKEHKKLVSELGKGDEVLTQGGLVGKITKVAEDKDFIEIMLNESNSIMVQKSAITAVLPKGTMKSLN